MRLAHRQHPRGADTAERRQWWSPDYRLALVTITLALVAAVLVTAYGGLHSPEGGRKIVAISGSAGFVIFAVTAVHSVSNQLTTFLAVRLGTGRAAVIRLVVRLVAYVLILLTTLSLLAVPVGRLLVGGAVTGVILGVAAQQSLANFFAGIMLMFARPFAVGDRIKVHSGALGGDYAGTVTDMGLTYVHLLGADGPALLPNAGVLNAAVHPRAGTTATQRAVPDTDQRDAPATEQEPTC